MKKIKNWLYRKDINLSNRWWHRLLVVIFFISFFVILFLIFKNDSNITQWKRNDQIEKRLTTKLNSVESLLKEKERLSYSVDESMSKQSVFLGFSNWFYEVKIGFNNIYCSKEIFSKFEEIKLNKQINEVETNILYIENDKSITFEKFMDKINEDNIKCLIVKYYDDNSTFNLNHNKILSFEGIKDFEKNYFSKISIINTIFYILIRFLFITLIFIGIIIFYYKVILYIIFGNKK
jgi:hypothetical protein